MVGANFLKSEASLKNLSAPTSHLRGHVAWVTRTAMGAAGIKRRLTEGVHWQHAFETLPKTATPGKQAKQVIERFVEGKSVEVQGLVGDYEAG